MPRVFVYIEHSLKTLFEVACASKPAQVRVAGVRAAIPSVEERTRVLLVAKITQMIKPKKEPESLAARPREPRPVALLPTSSASRLDAKNYAKWRAKLFKSERFGIEHFRQCLLEFDSVEESQLAIEDVWNCSNDAVQNAFSQGQESYLWRWIQNLRGKWLVGGGLNGGGVVFRMVKGAQDLSGLHFSDFILWIRLILTWPSIDDNRNLSFAKRLLICAADCCAEDELGEPFITTLARALGVEVLM